MEIDITKDEYSTLLEIFEIADWVLHAHKIEENPETAKYRNIEQKVFSYAEDFGFENLIRFDDHLEQYFPTKEFEETSAGMKFIEEFENDSFWDELTERLVLRDLIRQEGKDNILRMTLEKRFQKEEPLREKYISEFQNNGLNNIDIWSITK